VIVPGGVSTWIADAGDLRRPQALVDLRALLRTASPAEVTRARDSLVLISARGYHRGRDLMSEMNALSGLAP